MSETLLDRARSNYKAAQLLFKCIIEDDAYLNFAGYHLQQAVELAIKHVLETNGIKYGKTHDIAELMKEVPSDIQLDSNQIKIMADTITRWESKTRYIKNFRLSERLLEDGFEAVGKFLDSVPEGKVERTEELDDLISTYIDRSEIDDFYATVPRSIEINSDTAEFLINAYKLSKK